MSKHSGKNFLRRDHQLKQKPFLLSNNEIDIAVVFHFLDHSPFPGVSECVYLVTDALQEVKRISFFKCTCTSVKSPIHYT
jgi:hypothetical protein